MSLEQNEQVVLESFRILRTGEAAVADRIIAPDFINREAEDDPDRPDRGLRGPAALIATSVGCPTLFRVSALTILRWLRRMNALSLWQR
jgi:hypothetical protein